MRLALAIVGISTLLAGAAAAQPFTDSAARVSEWSVDVGATTSASRPSSWAEVTLEGNFAERGGWVGAMILPELESDGVVRLAAGGDAEGLTVSHGSRARLVHLPFPPDVPGAMMQASAHYRLDRHVRPKLSRPLSLLRRTYSGAEAGGELTAFELAGWHILTIGLTVGRVSQDTGDGIARHTRYDTPVTFFGWTRQGEDGAPDLELDFLAASGPAIAVDDGPDASLLCIDFAALHNLPIGGLYVDAAGGVAGTGTFELRYNGEVQTTVMTEDLPLVGTGVGSLRLHGSAGRLGFSLSAERALDLTADVHLVLDHRATMVIAWSGDRTEIAVEGFAARTRLWTDVDTSQQTLTGGGAVSWRRSLGANVTFDVTAHLARSFYAVLDADPTPRPQGIARLTVSMSKRLGGSARQ